MVGPWSISIFPDPVVEVVAVFVSVGIEGEVSSVVVGDSVAGLTQARPTGLRGCAPCRYAPVQNPYKPWGFSSLSALKVRAVVVPARVVEAGFKNCRAS